METSKIIIVPKMSKYEWDLHRYNLTHEQLIKKYAQDNIDADRILKSHDRQKESLNSLQKYFHNFQFVSRENFTRETARNADIIIALGGDNHLQYVSHFIDSTLLMGVNSDTARSEGALTYFTAEDFEKILLKIEKDDFDIEEWQRLECILNGTSISLTTSEYFLGENARKFMSRHILKIGDKEEEQKGSGLLVSTGAGSTGWYDSECRYLYPDGNIFPKTSKYARFLNTAPYRGKLNGYSMLEGKLEEGMELTVYSLNDSKGIVTSDSIEDYDFNIGAKAVIKLSKKPLNILKINRGKNE